MTQMKPWGFPQKEKIIDGHKYTYYKSYPTKFDAKQEARFIRKERGWQARIVVQYNKGYKRYHVYERVGYKITGRWKPVVIPKY